jgi:hypothetical protein
VDDFTLIGPPFLGMAVDCGALTCFVSLDDRLTGTLRCGANPRLDIVNQPVGVGGDLGCGVEAEGNWNASWRLVFP